jgi:aryl-alcohol dehydrogenase
MRRGDSPVYGSFFGQSSFASHALAYESNLVVVGDHVDLSVVAPLGCGVQTGAGAVLNVLRPADDASLVVFGAGAVGLSAVMEAKVAGLGTIIAVDPVADRRRSPRSSGRRRPSILRATTWSTRFASSPGAGATHALDTTAIGAGHQPGHRRAGCAGHAGAGGRGHARRSRSTFRASSAAARPSAASSKATRWRSSSSRGCSSSTPRGGCRWRS